MVILAIDTSMSACSAAVLRADKAAPVQRFEVMVRGHAEAIFPMIEAVMAETGVDYTDLTKIAVTLGPGSFTGIRAGVAAARGLALAAKRPLVGIGSLETMAGGVLRQTQAAERMGGFMIAHDARRGEIFAQYFDADGEALCEPAAHEIADAATWFPPGLGLIAGSGAATLSELMQKTGRVLRAVLPDLTPQAADLALIARHREPQRLAPAPLYLRSPDAKPQTDKSLARLDS
jgi:tRNA threonylcarbamoyladenosine biosynthesis protein TsaB